MSTVQLDQRNKISYKHFFSVCVLVIAVVVVVRFADGQRIYLSYSPRDCIRKLIHFFFNFAHTRMKTTAEYKKKKHTEQNITRVSPCFCTLFMYDRSSFISRISCARGDLQSFPIPAHSPTSRSRSARHSCSCNIFFRWLWLLLLLFVACCRCAPVMPPCYGLTAQLNYILMKIYEFHIFANSVEISLRNV